MVSLLYVGTYGMAMEKEGTGHLGPLNKHKAHPGTTQFTNIIAPLRVKARSDSGSIVLHTFTQTSVVIAGD
jgi:hypothetical protein